MTNIISKEILQTTFGKMLIVNSTVTVKVGDIVSEKGTNYFVKAIKLGTNPKSDSIGLLVDEVEKFNKNRGV